MKKSGTSRGVGYGTLFNLSAYGFPLRLKKKCDILFQVILVRRAFRPRFALTSTMARREGKRGRRVNPFLRRKEKRKTEKDILFPLVGP